MKTPPAFLFRCKNTITYIIYSMWSIRISKRMHEPSVSVAIHAHRLQLI